MEIFVENEIANFQVNAINSMLKRGLSDIEIAASLNQLKEPNLKNADAPWNAKDVRNIIAELKLGESKNREDLGSRTQKSKPKFKLVIKIGLDDVLIQVLIWVALVIFTLGLALPFWIYYFVKFVVESTEIHEIQ